MKIILPQTSKASRAAGNFVTEFDGELTISITDSTMIYNLAHISMTPEEAEVLMYDIQRKLNYMAAQGKREE